MASKAALLVEHVQNDFVHPDGAMCSRDARHVGQHIRELVHSPGFAFKVMTESHMHEDSKCLAKNHNDKDEWHDVDIVNPKNGAETYRIPLLPPVTKPGSWGAKTMDGVNASDFDLILEKFGHPEHITISSVGDIHGNRHGDMADGALSHDLETELKRHDIDTVVVIGAHGEFCVPHTATDLKKLGYRVVIVEDAVIFYDYSPETTDAVWGDVKKKGIEVVKSNDPVLAAIKSGQ